MINMGSCSSLHIYEKCDEQSPPQLRGSPLHPDRNNKQPNFVSIQPKSRSLIDPNTRSQPPSPEDPMAHLPHSIRTTVLPSQSLLSSSSGPAMEMGQKLGWRVTCAEVRAWDKFAGLAHRGRGRGQVQRNIGETPGCGYWTKGTRYEKLKQEGLGS